MIINVQKYDPTTDGAPHIVSGEIEYREQMTALEALLDFSNTVEPVSFEYSCKERFCGRCAMLLDGKPCLICIEPLSDDEHTFAPLSGFPVIRDLVVDRSSYDHAVSAVYNRIWVESQNEEGSRSCDFPTDVRQAIYSMNFCCRCGICDSYCPAKADFPDEYVGPSQMLGTGFRFLDPYDQGDRVMEAVNNGLFRCYLCGRCDEICPQQDIEHVALWQQLRDAAIERGIVPSYAQEA